jgi:glucosylceramidase
MVYRFPDYFILATEACTGYSPLEVRGPVLGSWERGERYSHSIIEVSPRQTIFYA